jgi:NitT/TauT family transport system permease protein
VEAFFEPFVSFCRYLPASAFIPLLILWAGIGERRSCW